MERRKTNRHKSELPVRISGMANGKPFNAQAMALNVSWTGACLSGVHLFKRPGETIRVQCGKEKGLFAVAWVADPSSQYAGQVGLQNLNPMNWIWGTAPPPKNEKLVPREEPSLIAEKAIATPAAEKVPEKAKPVAERAKPARAPRIAKVSDSGMYTHLEWRDNRRTHDRMAISAAVEIQVTGQELTQWGTARDLSPRGCCVQTPAPLPTGCRVDLTFRVNAKQISVRGAVRNFTPNKGMGIEFLLISKQDQQLLMDAGSKKIEDLKLW
jgi:PilZ domain